MISLPLRTKRLPYQETLPFQIHKQLGLNIALYFA